MGRKKMKGEDPMEGQEGGEIGRGRPQFEGLSLICQALDEATSSSPDTTPDASVVDSDNNKQTLPSHSTYPHFLSTLFQAAETIIGNEECKSELIKGGAGRDMSEGASAFTGSVAHVNKINKDNNGNIKMGFASVSATGVSIDKDIEHKKPKKEKKDSIARRKKKAEDINSEAIASAIMARETAALNGLPHEEIDLSTVGIKRKGKSLRPKRRFDADQKLNIVVGKLKSYYQKTNGDRLGTPLTLPKVIANTDILLKVEES